MQRTIREAKAVLAQMPLTGHQRFKAEEAYREQVEELVAGARTRFKREAKGLKERGERYAEEAKALDRELAALTERLDRDELTLDEADPLFADVRDRYARLERVTRDLPVAAEALREAEADPEAHLDALFSKYPRTMPNWPW